MSPFAPELVWALVAILALTGLYVWVAQEGIPPPSSVIGHGLGIVGFLMMLATETLYTLRKRLRGFNFGRTSLWLQLHVFTGLVGPYLVLLHSAGKFYGLAGVVTLLTGIMVLSGFVGRYIYTAAPRTLEGVEVDLQELQAEISRADAELQALDESLRETVRSVLTIAVPPGWIVVLGRPFLRWWQGQRVRQALRPLRRENPAQANRLGKLLTRRYRLLLQVHSLAAARRLLAVWHVLHVPLGGVLFGLAFVHIGAALYYATLLK